MRPTFFRKVLLSLGAAVLFLLGFVIARTAFHGTAKPEPEESEVIAVPEGAVERLAGALRFPTISHEDAEAFDAEPFRGLHAYLETVFPKVHAELRRETVGTHSLLYTWVGTEPALEPILFMGHQDVVPVEPGTETEWQQPPFGGRIADGFVWGRGSIDNKSAVVGLLEAVEMLLGAGFRPARTVFLAFGHDEETGGTKGAKEIARLLAERGVRLEMVLDEGGVIGDGVLPGISAPVALVGVAEKGFLSVELRARVAGGHSSLPPQQTAIGILGAAVTRLEQNQMPSRIEGPTRQLFESIAPSLAFARRAVFANLWLTRGVVSRRLEGSPATNAMVRTTTAPTIVQGGAKDNILPNQARAVINFRIHPGDSTGSVLEHIRRVVDDTRVVLTVVGRFSAEPSAVSRTDSDVFRTLDRAIRSVNRDAIVAPYLVVVATDSRYFSRLSDDVFRFLPLRLRAGDLDRMHGTNERIGIREYEDAIRTYRQLILKASEG